jgi:predicted membrane protein
LKKRGGRSSFVGLINSLFHHQKSIIMNKNPRSRTFFFAVIIIAAGIVLLLAGLGIIPWEIRRILISWPMLLIVAGIYSTFSDQHRVLGYLLLGVGGYFMINKFYFIGINFWQVIWPLVLIAIGVSIILKHNRSRRQLFGTERFTPDGEPIVDGIGQDSDYIDEVSIFSGSEKTITSKNFRGGKITSIFGGSEINLTQAQLSPATNNLEITAIFGGSTLIVPPDWQIKVNVTAIFGGISDKRYKRQDIPTDETKILYIDGLVLFGGGEIKSY